MQGKLRRLVMLVDAVRNAAACGRRRGGDGGGGVVVM